MTDAPPTGRHSVTNICTDMEATREFYEETPGSRFVDPGEADE